MRVVLFSLFIVLLFTHEIDAQTQYPTDYTFESYKIKEGLSEGGTYSVFQDHLGYVWVGTIGLERFDGYVFKNYRSSVFDTISIPSGQKLVIKEDPALNLWVCTLSTISILDRSTDTWKNYLNNKINSTLSDISFGKSKNEIFISTNGDGLFLFNPVNNSWKQYRYGTNIFLKMAEISENELLISTVDGLVIFDKEKKKFIKSFLETKAIATEINFRNISKKDKTHWYVSSTKGIYIFSKEEGLKPAFQFQKGDINSIMGNNVTAIYYDSLKEEIWAKIAKVGLDIIHLKTNTITHLKKDNYPDENFIKNSINSITKDNQGNIWLATNDGVFKYNPTKKEIKTISDKEPYDLKFPFTKTWGAYIDNEKHLWVAGADNLTDGIIEIDPKTKKVTKHLQSKEHKIGIAWIITEDAKKNIWAFNTKLSLNAGFEVFKKIEKENKFSWYGNTNNIVKDKKALVSFGQNYITENKNFIFAGKPAYIMVDSSGNLSMTPYAPLNTLKNDIIYSFFNTGRGKTYILTDSKIILWNETKNTFKSVTTKINFKDFTYRSIFSMFNLVVYKDSIAYISGYDYGLVAIDLKNQTKKYFSTNEGMPTQLVYDLKLDSGNNLWMSSDYGLIRYSISKNQFKNLTPSEGAQGYEYNSWANFMTKDGNFIYSGQGGVNYFNYKDITDNEQKPNVIIQKVTIKNKVIPIESNKKDDPINVAYNENIVSFDFVAFNYKNTLQNKYKYKMEGYEIEWRESGSRHYTTYTNLPAGEYTFRVIASNNDGLWNEEGAYVKIKILPAPWFTWWAFLIYTFIILFVIYKFIFYKQNQQKRKLEEERKNNELAEAKALQERLLPKHNPKITHLDIGTYLRTSTEVGGDYYDFFEQPDGSLYTICGDATGHGTPSGMLVSITKAGIIGLPEMLPNKMLSALNTIVKKVDLGILRMSLNIALLKGNILTLSSAGMPPYFIYRAQKKLTEEILLSGIPLGSFNKVAYDEHITEFNKGDILAIISDGLAEAPNAIGELFDYPQIQNLITQYAHLDAKALIDTIMLKADQWLAGSHNPDDITIIIIKHN